MLNTTLDFSGLEDLSKDLELLSRAENNKVLRDATRAGAKVLAQAVRDKAPEKSGKLKRNIVVATVRGRPGVISSGVHIRGRSPSGETDNTMKADNPNNAFYWRFVELGTVHQPAQPFLRPAFDEQENAATSAALAQMNQAIDKVLKS